MLMNNCMRLMYMDPNYPHIDVIASTNVSIQLDNFNWQGLK